MLNPDVTKRIRAIFLHDGSPVTIFDFILLLGWDVATFEAAVKWRVLTVEPFPTDVPHVSHAQLVLRARDQWTDTEIVEALGADAHRVRLFDAAATVEAPSAGAVGCDAPRMARRPRLEGVVATRARGSRLVSSRAPAAAHAVNAVASPAGRARGLRAVRRDAFVGSMPPLPARRHRTDGIREATFTATATGYRTVVPYLRLRGHWLAQLGFSPETRIYIAAEQGRLVITAADPAAAVDVAPPALVTVGAAGASRP